MDFTTITAAVDFADVIAAIAGIGAVLAGFYVARKGLYLVLGMLRSRG